MGQVSWHGWTEFSVQSLTGLKSRCWLGCIHIWSLESSSKLIQVAGRIHFLVVVVQRCLISSCLLASCALSTTWQFAPCRPVGESILYFASLRLLIRAHWMKLCLLRINSLMKWTQSQPIRYLNYNCKILSAM